MAQVIVNPVPEEVVFVTLPPRRRVIQDDVAPAEVIVTSGEVGTVVLTVEVPQQSVLLPVVPA